MTKNPIINAILALGYICIVALIMFYGTKHIDSPETVIIPVAMLSLFTLSAAVMGYIFLSQPLQLYLDNNKKEAVDLFTKTLAVFSVITITALSLLFSGVLS